MKKKELQSLLQELQVFDDPKLDLEQYPTSPEVAAAMLHMIDSTFQDIEGHTVIDLGCGTGMLGIGAAALGSSYVLGVDVDGQALSIARSNIEETGCSEMVDLLQSNVAALEKSLPRLRAHTVIMNPPFGTWMKGADVAFLRAAFRVATGAVYSLHKSSTRAHLQRFAKQQLGPGRDQVLCQVKFDLPSSYAFHKEKSKDIAVDLWRFQV